MMPVLGWFTGSSFNEYFVSIKHWIAFVLLAFVGGRMIYSGLIKPESSWSRDPSRGYSLIALSIATSIDALAIGLSLSMLHVDIWYPSVMIGAITALFSLLAIHIGRKVGHFFEDKMEVAGGLILIGIGLKILISHFVA
jgi:putative Mn2+ efflux pump MntP